MNQVNVLLASDANYLPYLEVALKSLLTHHHNLTVFVLNTGDIPSSWANQLSWENVLNLPTGSMKLTL